MSARRDCSTYSNPACNLPAAAVTIRNTPGSVPGKDAQATGGVGAEPPQRGSESRPPGRHCGRRRRWPQATGQRRSPRRVSWPVGRVLCARLRGPTAIHLGLSLPTASCGLPASIGRAALERLRGKPRPEAPPSLLTLLRVGFTEPPESPPALVVSYTTVSPLPLVRCRSRGGLLSVALSRGSPRVGVTDHPALRSPDLPHRDLNGPGATARPAHPPDVKNSRPPGARCH